MYQTQKLWLLKINNKKAIDSMVTNGLQVPLTV